MTNEEWKWLQKAIQENRPLEDDEWELLMRDPYRGHDWQEEVYPNYYGESVYGY